MGRSVLNRKQKRISTNLRFLSAVRETRLLVACVAVLCYLNSMCGEFVFDDHEVIVTNLDIRQSTPLSSVFLNDFWGTPIKSNLSHKSFRPITIVTFRWNFFLGRLNPLGYHIFNIILHSLVTVLFFNLCLKIFHGCVSQSGISSIVFAVHPIHTEAVASVVGRADILCGLFYLLSILSYTNCFPVYSSRGFDKSLSRPFRYSRLWLSATIVFSVLSLLSKEQGITVLAVCILYDVSFVCQIGITSLYQLSEHISRFKVLSCPIPKWFYLLLERIVVLVMICIVLLFARISFLAEGTPTFTESDNPSSFHPGKWTRFRTYLYIISLNGWLLLCPSSLCYDWSMDSIARVKSWTDKRNVLSLTMVVIFSSLVFYGLNQEKHRSSESKTESKKNYKEQLLASNTYINYNCNFTKRQSTRSEIKERIPKKIPSDNKKQSDCKKSSDNKDTLNRDKQTVVFALGMVVIPFLPASNIFFPVGFVVAERILYIPSMGYCMLVAVGVSRLFYNDKLHTLKKRNDRQVQKEFSSWSWCNPSWADLTLPGKVFILGLLLILSLKTVCRNTEWKSSQTLAEAGLKVNPGNAKIHLTMANALAQKGHLRCEIFYREALRLRPHYAAAWTNLGVVLLNTGRTREAERAYLKALSIRPGSGDASTNYAHLLRGEKRYEEADKLYQRALVIRPNDVHLLHFHAVVLEKLGKYEEAAEKYQNVCNRNHDNLRSCTALGRLLAAPFIDSKETLEPRFNKQIKKADKYLKMSLSAAEDDAETQLLLGRLYWQTKKFDKAELEIRQLLTRHPNSVAAEYTLGRVLESKGILEESKKLYRQVLKKDHTHSGARQALERLLNHGTARKLVDSTFAANMSPHALR